MWEHGRWRPWLAEETQVECEVEGAGDIAGPFSLEATVDGPC